MHAFQGYSPRGIHHRRAVVPAAAATPRAVLPSRLPAVLWALAMLTVSGTVLAQGSGTEAPLPLGGDGSQTRNWVQYQTSNRGAERPADGQHGEVAERVWKRYVDSFSYPIPEEFERDDFSTSD